MVHNIIRLKRKAVAGRGKTVPEKRENTIRVRSRRIIIISYYYYHIITMMTYYNITDGYYYSQTTWVVSRPTVASSYATITTIIYASDDKIIWLLAIYYIDVGIFRDVSNKRENSHYYRHYLATEWIFCAARTYILYIYICIIFKINVGVHVRLNCAEV